MKCELNVKTYKNKENLTKKQGKINKKTRSAGKIASAKRREMMGNTWGKSCSPHKAEECPRAAEFWENVRDRRSQG